MSYRGRIQSARRCLPIENAEVQGVDAGDDVVFKCRTNSQGDWQTTSTGAAARVSVSHPDFITKVVDASIEEVRLLGREIVGYTDALSYEPNSEISVSVHSSLPFRATLYRHGLEKSEVAPQQEYATSLQEISNDSFTMEGPNWPTTFAVKSPDVRGLYSIRLEDGQSEMAMPFVVRSVQPAQPLLVLLCVATWQCYNLWGGRSRYRSYEDNAGAVGLKPTRKTLVARLESAAARRLPVSIKSILKRFLGRPTASTDWMNRRLGIKRPIDCSGLEGDDVRQPFTNHLAGSDWRLLAWLERENIPFDVAADIDLETDPKILEGRQAVILSSHSEYWSRVMYRTLCRFHREEGGWILNLSGNSIFGEIEVFDDGSVRYIGPFRESGMDEVETTCSRVTNEDYGTCAAYHVVEPDHWVFAGVPLTDGTVGHDSLNQETPRENTYYDPARPETEVGLVGQGASGWETDKRQPNTPEDAVLLAKGMNPSGGAEMLLREPADTRGGMFSVGSITFAGSLLVDRGTSALTANVLKRALEPRESD